MMIKDRFTRVVAWIMVVLVFASIVLTIVGAFCKGDVGKGLLLTGMFGFCAIAVLGWVMITVYNRVHRDENTVRDMLKDGKEGDKE